VRIDGTAVGDGTPGPIARRLHAELRARLDALRPADPPAVASISP
jgi:hypothetical protein